MLDSLATRWSAHLRGMRFEDLPDEVVGRAKVAILDAIAVSGAGSNTPAAAAVEAYVAARDGGTPPEDGPCVYPTGRRFHSGEAAGLVQGVYAYGHLYGDTSLRSVSHPGAVVVPAVLVAAQQRAVSGREAILATVLGYEVMEAFAAALNGHPRRMALQIRGLRPTALCGPLGVVAAAATLADVDAATTAAALAIATNHGAGLRPNDGDPRAAILVQTGTAVQLGLAALGLATAGVAGHPHAFEGPGGFLEAYGGPDTPPVEPGGDGWAISRTAVKLHATAHTLAPALDLLLTLRREHALDPASITEVHVHIPDAHGSVSGGDKPLPATAANAASNYPYCAAVALVAGEPLWPSVIATHLHDPVVASLARKVRVHRDPQLSASFDSGEALWPARVEVVSGTSRLERATSAPTGVAFDQATVDGVARKLRALLPLWPQQPRDPEGLVQRIMALEGTTDVHTDLLAAVRP